MKEAKSGDCGLVEENGVRTHVSRGCEKGTTMKMPSARTTTACVPGYRGAVETAGRELGWEWEVWYS